MWSFTASTGPCCCQIPPEPSAVSLQRNVALLPRSLKKSQHLIHSSKPLLACVIAAHASTELYGSQRAGAHDSKHQNRSFWSFSTLLWDVARKPEAHTAGSTSSSQKRPKSRHTWDTVAGAGMQCPPGLQGWWFDTYYRWKVHPFHL